MMYHKNEDGSFSPIAPRINDGAPSDKTTYSGNKVEEIASNLADNTAIASTTTGVNPSITDSADGYMQDLTVYGESRVSKNLLDAQTVTVNNITFTVDSDKYITASPANSDPRLWEYSNAQWKFTLPAGEYVVACYNAVLSTDSNSSIYVITNIGTQISKIFNLNTATKSDYFTLSRSTDIGVMAKLYDAKTRIMICKKSDYDADPTFEPYFSGIHGIGENGLEVATYGTGFTPTLTQGTYSSNDGQITVISTRVCTDNFYHVSPSAKYKVFASTGETGKTIRLSINYWVNDSHGNNQKISDTEWQDSGYSFTPPSNCNYISIATSYADDSAMAPVDISVSINNLITATVTTGIPLYSVGDVKDELDEKKGVIVKRCEKKNLNDLEWVLTSNNRWSTPLINAKPVSTNNEIINAISNNYTAVSANTLYPNLQLIAMALNIQNDLLIRNGSDIDTPTGDIVYELAEPYEIPLTSSEISALRNLRTYNPITNVTITDTPTVDIGYLLNTANGQAVADVQIAMHQLITGALEAEY